MIEAPPNCSFTLSGYQSLVNHYLNDGYTIRNFNTCDPAARHLVLRHDIDMSLNYATQMAKAEQEIGVSATYFVLLRHGLYNLWSRENVDLLKRIRDMGHIIGLHFDASLYAQDHGALEKAVESECGLLESLTNEKVDVISFHRPAEQLVGYDKTLAGRIHTYMPKFTQDMNYFADSRGEWRFGHPMDASLEKSLQLLTHPIWWVFDKNASTLDKLKSYLAEKAEQDSKILGQNCRPYQEYLDDITKR